MEAIVKAILKTLLAIPLLLPTLWAGALLPAREASAQETSAPESTPGEVFFDALDVTLVNVDVFVTDRDGERVRGLGRDDFELLEDGRPVEVTHFRAYEAGRRVDTPGTPGRPGPEPGPPPPRGAPTPPEQPLHLVIYFDNLHLSPPSRNRVVGEVRRFINSRLQRDDRAMLVTFERSLNVRQPFTGDRRHLLTALEEVPLLAALGAQRATERRDVLERLRSVDSYLEAESQIDFYAKSAYDDLGRSIDALKEMVTSLAGLPGRKALLYVSDGLPMTVAEDLFFLADQERGGGTTGQLVAARYRARDRFRVLTAQANASGVTLYTIDAQGLRSAASLSAEQGRRSTSLFEADGIHDANLGEPLILMAADTGGLAAVNTNNIGGALDEMATDLTSYYSLAYRPPSTADGRYRRLEVKVRDRRGLTLRHRAGYRAKSATVRLEEGTTAALLYRSESNPLGITLAFEAPRPQKDGQYEVPLLVRIPLGNLALLPRGDMHRGEVQIVIGVADGEGNRSGLTRQTVPIDIPSADLPTARTQHFTYVANLLMRGGIQRIAVGLADSVAGEMSFVRRVVEIE